MPRTAPTYSIDEYASDEDTLQQSPNAHNKPSLHPHNYLHDPYMDELRTQQLSHPSNTTTTSNLPSTPLDIIDKNDWRWALQPTHISLEWRPHAPTTSLLNLIMTHTSQNYANSTKTCKHNIDNCHCVHRLIFVMKYYSLWMKSCSSISPTSSKHDYPTSASALIESLRHYSADKLLSDWLHVRHYHLDDDILIAYIHRSQIPDCNDNTQLCRCLTRNHRNKEIYKHLSRAQRGELYWMKERKQEEEEMREIALQRLLDVIHTSLLHNAISDGAKFVTSIPSDMSSCSVANNIVDAPHFAFGSASAAHVVKHLEPKYPDLRTELLNNEVHKLALQDFDLLYLNAQSFVDCNEGGRRYNVVKDKVAISLSVEHVIVLLSRCNYCDVTRKFSAMDLLQLHRKDNDKSVCEDRWNSIAHWCSLLFECVVLFGSEDMVNEIGAQRYVYHGLGVKLTFRDVEGVHFEVPLSCTTQYSVAKNFASVCGMCLKLCKGEFGCRMFDVSDLSDYPNEKEVVMFGCKLGFVDIVYDGLSHYDYVMSLQLYQRIIRGRLFAGMVESDADKDGMISKKHQRRIVKMMENMMSSNSLEEESSVSLSSMVDVLDNVHGLNYIDPYVQALFEAVTRNVLKRTVWINKESDALLPELKSVYVNVFVPFLKKQLGLESRYAHVDEFVVSKKHVLMTERSRPLKSKPFDHIEILNNEDNDDAEQEEDGEDALKEKIRSKDEPLTLQEFNILKEKKKNKRKKTSKGTGSGKKKRPSDLKITFGFRCYRKWDSKNKKDMFKGEFVIDEMPKQVESVKMLGGLWFPEIGLSKWDWCSFTHQKLTKGSSLFSLDKIGDDEQVKVKICYQVKEVNEKVSLP